MALSKRQSTKPVRVGAKGNATFLLLMSLVDKTFFYEKDSGVAVSEKVVRRSFWCLLEEKRQVCTFALDSLI